MGWVQRGDRRYYYRSTRAGAGPRERYLGAGPAAELAAAADQQRQHLRVGERSGLRVTEQAVDRASNLIREASEWTELMVLSALLLAGFHQHDRHTWRRRRNAHRDQ